MQINNSIVSNTKVTTQIGNNLDIVIDNDKVEESPEIIIKDEVTISEEGKELFRRLSNEDMFSPENIKAWENEFNYDTRSLSFEEEFDNLFIDLAFEYKNKFEELENSSDDEFSIQRLNEAYMNDLEGKIDSIAEDIDRYFDKGRFLSDEYSEEPLEDLFDKDLFKDNLKASILETKDYIMNSDEVSREEVYENLLNGQKTKSLEKMSFNDLKVLHNFIKESANVESSIGQYDISSVKEIADKEKELNNRIEGLGLSDTVKNSMVEVNHRFSDGLLKHIAYKEERDKYINDVQKYDKLLKRLLNRLLIINEALEGVKENGGISPNNKRIFKYLEMKQELMEEYKKLKDEKDEREESFITLNDNKHTIVEYDSYKRVKDEYDKEMSKE